MPDEPASPHAPGRDVRDPRVLRGLAHPARSRILDEMSATGPMRAADIARELGIPANQASFHLRQLAKYGLVEEAPGEARDRRDRVWQLVADEGLVIHPEDLEALPGGAAAVGVWRRQALGRAHHAVDTAYLRRREEETTTSVTDLTLRLTKSEAQQLTAELQEVLHRWGERTRGRNTERRSYLLTQILQPHPETLVESDGATRE
jgi:predicted ArsR family transcriptional regulator